MFYLGILMIFYDLMGHYLTLLAHLGVGTKVISYYGKYVYLSFSSPIVYNLYWSSFFTVALLLIIFGRKQK